MPLPVVSNDHPPHDATFRTFFETWLAEQNNHLQALTAAVNTGESPPELRSLIGRVLDHYEAYYRAKHRWAHRDVLSMLTPRWRSSFEDAFLWIGGWRPTMAFHLLYSKSGLQLRAAGKLDDLIGGVTPSASGGDLADITPAQLGAVDELQRRTVREEKKISEKMAKQQETVAGSDLVELSHEATELLNDINGAIQEERVESALKPKEKGFEEVLDEADELRLKTLKAVIDVLTVSQAVHFLIAAAELHLRIHDWGLKRDAAISNGIDNNNNNN